MSLFVIQQRQSIVIYNINPLFEYPVTLVDNLLHPLSVLFGCQSESIVIQSPLVLDRNSNDFPRDERTNFRTVVINSIRVHRCFSFV